MPFVSPDAASECERLEIASGPESFRVVVSARRPGQRDGISAGEKGGRTLG